MTGAIAAGRQARVGLTLAAALMLAWAAIHVGGIFFWDWGASWAWAVVPLVLAQAWLSTGLFIVAHDAMHGSLAPGRTDVNRAVGTLALGAYAALSYRALLPKHHAHHAAPGTADDPDFHAGAPTSLVAWFVRFFRGYYTHGQIARITAVTCIYLLLGARLSNIVIFWAVPAILALVQLFVFGTWLPHRHAADGFVDQHNARSTRLAPLASLATCFHFGGYHHEHHLSPGTPWWMLPRARER